MCADIFKPLEMVVTAVAERDEVLEKVGDGNSDDEYLS